MDTAEAIIFYIIVFFAITGALFAVFANKIIHSVISAFITFLSVGILFFALELPYLGTAQIAILTAGLSILFIFAILLTEKDKQNKKTGFSPKILIGVTGIFLIAAFVVLAIKTGDFYLENLMATGSCIMPSSRELAIEMFVNYGAPFVFTSLFFLAGILGLGVIISNKTGGKK